MFGFLEVCKRDRMERKRKRVIEEQGASWYIGSIFALTSTHKPGISSWRGGSCLYYTTGISLQKTNKSSTYHAATVPTRRFWVARLTGSCLVFKEIYQWPSLLMRSQGGLIWLVCLFLMWRGSSVASERHATHGWKAITKFLQQSLLIPRLDN